MLVVFSVDVRLSCLLKKPHTVSLKYHFFLLDEQKLILKHSWLIKMWEMDTIYAVGLVINGFKMCGQGGHLV